MLFIHFFVSSKFLHLTSEVLLWCHLSINFYSIKWPNSIQVIPVYLSQVYQS